MLQAWMYPAVVPITMTLTGGRVLQHDSERIPIVSTTSSQVCVLRRDLRAQRHWEYQQGCHVFWHDSFWSSLAWVGLGYNPI
jgi:hypothetical protein